MRILLASSVLALMAAASSAPALAADYDVYDAPAQRPVVSTVTRVLPPIVHREVIEQPIIRERVVERPVVTRRVVRPAPVIVERRVVERPVVIEETPPPVFRERVVVTDVARPWRRPAPYGHFAWGGFYGGPHW